MGSLAWRRSAMNGIPADKLKYYRQLAQRGLWEIKDDRIGPFYERAQAEGVELVSNNFSTLGMFRAPHSKCLDNVDIALVGIPLDIGVPNPRPGTRLAPRELRYWSLDRNLAHHVTRICPFDLCSIIDWGDVEFTEDIYNLDADLAEIERVYAGFRGAGVIPLSIGGEHTCTYPVLRALGKEEPLCVIHLDAHCDTSVQFGGCRVSDATLLQNATVDGVIDPEHTIQIGLRGRGMVRSDFSYDAGMRVVLAEEFQSRGVEAIVREARELIGDRRCYLTLDTDVIDCGDMPGTTLPEPFGLTGREVRDFIRGMRGMNLVGADLMELSPVYDPTGKSACLASGLAFELLCVLAETRALHTGRENKTHWAKSE